MDRMSVVELLDFTRTAGRSELRFHGPKPRLENNSCQREFNVDTKLGTCETCLTENGATQMTRFFREGFEAASKNAIRNNPYPSHSWKSAEWFRGWALRIKNI
jgi:hypothetical protein